MSQTMFDPNAQAPATGAAGQLPVSGPEGHILVITSSEVKPTQSGTGGYMQINFQVTEGTAKGSTGSENLNLINANETTVEIAKRELTAIAYCVGQVQAFDYQNNPEVLYNKPFRAVVGLQKGTNGTEKGYTEVQKYLLLDGSPPSPNNIGGGQGQPGGMPPGMQQPGGMPQQQQQMPQQMPGNQPQQQQQVQQPQQQQMPQQQQPMQQQQMPQQQVPQQQQMPQQQVQQPQQQVQQQQPAVNPNTPWVNPQQQQGQPNQQIPF